MEAAAAVPATIIDRRLVKKGNAAVPQVKLTWTGLPASSATWEDYHVVKKCFPEAPAWGQAATQAGEVSRLAPPLRRKTTEDEYIFIPLQHR
jgi:hypothetical protein